MIENAVLHDARAAQLRQAGGDRAPKIVDRPGHFHGVLRRPVAIGVPGVLRQAKGVLGDVLAGPR